MDGVDLNFTDQEKDALTKLGQHMGNPLEESDMKIVQRVQKLQAGRESNYQKMHAAQTGMAPSEFQEQEQKQTGALQRQAATQSQAKATQAQAAETSPSAPPAPAGSAGVSAPYPAQAKPGAVPTAGNPPKQQPQQQQQPPPGAPGAGPQLPED